jgi:hypothetical protein
VSVLGRGFVYLIPSLPISINFISIYLLILFRICFGQILRKKILMLMSFAKTLSIFKDIAATRRRPPPQEMYDVIKNDQIEATLGNIMNIYFDGYLAGPGIAPHRALKSGTGSRSVTVFKRVVKDWMRVVP